VKRRDFLLTGSIAAITLSLGAAPAPQEKKQYVCPPCGCSHDGQIHDQPGKCPVCGMALVDAAALNESSAIPNFSKVNDNVWTAGQPTMDQFAKLKQEGVKVVINLRVPSEGNNIGVTEAAKAKEMGLAYFNIPVVFGDPKPQSVDEFLRVTDAQLKNGPVLIHCAAAVRVSAFWMIRRVLRDGWTFDQALQEANKIGLGNQPQLVEFARQYIAGHKAE
jgi:uncharacterized protein (TIGR01244 family)